MFNLSAVVLLTVAIIPSVSPHLVIADSNCPSTRWEKGGAIIDLTDPGHSLTKLRRGGIGVKVLEVRKGNQVVLSLSREQGARKGQTGFLIADSLNSMSGIAFVELTEVGEDYAIGQYKTLGSLSRALTDKENPVRNEILVWSPRLSLAEIESMLEKLKMQP